MEVGVIPTISLFKRFFPTNMWSSEKIGKYSQQVRVYLTQNSFKSKYYHLKVKKSIDTKYVDVITA